MITKSPISEKKADNGRSAGFRSLRVKERAFPLIEAPIVAPDIGQKNVTVIKGLWIAGKPLKEKG